MPRASYVPRTGWSTGGGVAFNGFMVVLRPVVITCLDLGVVPWFIPLREPWRGGVVEHFNDVWDKSFFPHRGLLRCGAPRGGESRLHQVHNAEHRYSAHYGSSPDEVWRGRPARASPGATSCRSGFRPRGRIESIREPRPRRR
jgi:hypothetical protein